MKLSIIWDAFQAAVKATALASGSVTCVAFLLFLIVRVASLASPALGLVTGVIFVIFLALFAYELSSRL